MVTFVAQDNPPELPHAGVSLGDCTLALYPFVPEEHAARRGRHRDRPGVSVLGLRVAGLSRGRSALRDAGVGILRDRPGSLVLDPAGTGDVEIVLVADLLPGDPRGAPGATNWVPPGRRHPGQ